MDAFCALQPQLHHLDALADNERASKRVAGRDTDINAPEPEAKAVTMAVKGTEDEEELDMGEVAKTLRAMQEEPWQQLEWVDEDVRISAQVCWRSGTGRGSLL